MAFCAIAPTSGSAQIEVSGMCVHLSEGPGCLSYDLLLEAPDRPVALESAEFVLETPGWTFTEAMYVGEDAFGPFAGRGSIPDPSTLFMDFLDGLGFPVEFVAPFPARLSVRTSGTTIPRFSWRATEIDGSVVSGRSEVVAAPEPGTFLLLLTALLALIGLKGRERACLGAGS
jgi:hypothetical protein